MNFAIAVKGTKVAESMESCDALLIFEENCGKAVLRQRTEIPAQKDRCTPDFWGRSQIEALLCGKIEEENLQVLKDSKIRVLRDVSGDVEQSAAQFASTIKKEANKRSCLQPDPKVLVSCRGLDGEDNVLAVGYCGNCSYAPPMVMVGIVPTRYSYRMIKESGCFVVNLVDKSYQETFDYLGSHSKRDGDKLAEKKVRLEDGKKVNAPILLDCPVNIECTVVDSIVTGSHEMFIGKVEYVHADARISDREGKIDFNQIQFI